MTSNRCGSGAQSHGSSTRSHPSRVSDCSHAGSVTLPAAGPASILVTAPLPSLVIGNSHAHAHARSHQPGTFVMHPATPHCHSQQSHLKMELEVDMRSGGVEGPHWGGWVRAPSLPSAWPCCAVGGRSLVELGPSKSLPCTDATLSRGSASSSGNPPGHSDSRPSGREYAVEALPIALRQCWGNRLDHKPSSQIMRGRCKPWRYTGTPTQNCTRTRRQHGAGQATGLIGSMYRSQKAEWQRNLSARNLALNARSFRLPSRRFNQTRQPQQGSL